jgi:hypothetical protein
MNTNERGAYSAASSALGYLYQVRYALLESLRRLRKTEQFVVSIETLDDVVFKTDGDAPEMLQTKQNCGFDGQLAGFMEDAPNMV